MQILTCTIKKFWYEIWEWYTMIINLNEKLKSIQQMYNIMIHPADQDKQLIEDTGVAILKFQAFVLRSSDFKEIKFKIDGSIIKDLVELKRKDLDKVWITLESFNM